MRVCGIAVRNGFENPGGKSPLSMQRPSLALFGTTGCGGGCPPSGKGACPNSRCSILSESDSTLGYEQGFSPLEYRSDTASAAKCAGLRPERPCLAVYR